jgi:hypothetical protein
VACGAKAAAGTVNAPRQRRELLVKRMVVLVWV